MKIKYTQHKITFKISRDELESLIQEKEIDCEFIFTHNKAIRHELCKAPIKHMRLSIDGALPIVTLQVSAKVLETLKTPSKHGAVSSYFHEGLEYFFSLEVDLKSKKSERHHAR